MPKMRLDYAVKGGRYKALKVATHVELAGLLNELRGGKEEERDDGVVVKYVSMEEQWKVNPDGSYTVTWWEVMVENYPSASDPFAMTLGDLFSGRWTRESRRLVRAV